MIKMNKIKQAFHEGFQKEAQEDGGGGLTPAQKKALKRRIMMARKRGMQSAQEASSSPLMDDAMRGAGIGGTLGAGLGYMNNSNMMRKGVLGGAIGAGTLAANSLME